MATVARKRQKMVNSAIDMDKETIEAMKNGEWPISKIVCIGEMNGSDTQVLRQQTFLE